MPARVYKETARCYFFTSTSARTFSTSALSREEGTDIITIDEFEGLGSRVDGTIMGWQWR